MRRQCVVWVEEPDEEWANCSRCSRRVSRVGLMTMTIDSGAPPALVCPGCSNVLSDQGWRWAG